VALLRERFKSGMDRLALSRYRFRRVLWMQSRLQIKDGFYVVAKGALLWYYLSNIK
jgi:hypothetical protein